MKRILSAGENIDEKKNIGFTMVAMRFIIFPFLEQSRAEQNKANNSRVHGRTLENMSERMSV